MRPLKWLVYLLLMVLLMLASALSGLTWVMKSPSGTRWLTEQLPNLLQDVTGQTLTFEDVSGTLWDGLSVRQVMWAKADTRVRVTELKVQAVLSGVLNRHIDALRLQAKRVQVDLPPPHPDDPPFVLPRAIAIPLRIDLEQLQIDELQVANVHISQLKGQASARAGHLFISALSGEVNGVQVNLNGQVQLKLPYDLQAQVDADKSLNGLLLNAQAQASGSLRDLQVKLKATAQDAQRAQVQQSLNMQAGLTPFEGARLRQLALNAKGFNPALWWPGAPKADLSAELTLKPNPELTRSEGQLSLSNALPMAWWSGGLPLATVKGVWGVDLVDLQPTVLDWNVSQIALQLPNQPAGQLSVQGRWTMPSSKRPVQGGVEATFRGVGVWPQVVLDSPKAPPLDINLKVAQKSAQVWAVEQLQVREQARGAGAVPAQIDAQGQWDLAGQQPGQGVLTLSQFNPGLYLPAKQQGRASTLQGQLNGRVQWEGVWNRAQQPWPQGTLLLDFADSQLGQWPFKLQGQTQLAGQRILGLKLSAEVLGNTLQAEGGYGSAADVLQLNVQAPALERIGVLVNQPLRGSANVVAQVQGQGVQWSAKGQAQARSMQLPGTVALDQLDAQFQMGAQANSPWIFQASVSNLRKLAQAQPSSSGKKNIEAAAPVWLKQAQVNLMGTRAQHSLQLNFESGLKPFSNQRVLAGRIQLQGGLDQKAHWKGQWTQAQLAGLWRPVRSLSLQKPVDVSASLANGVEIGELQLKGEDNTLIENQQLRVSGQVVELRGRAPKLTLPQLSSLAKSNLSFETDDLVLGGQWAFQQSPSNISGSVDFQQISGGFRILEDGELEVPINKMIVNAKLNASQLDVATQLDAGTFGQANGAVRVPIIKGSQTQAWQVHETGRLEGGLSLSVSDLTWLGPLLQGGVRTTGAGQVAVALSGTPAQPQVQGRLFAKDLVVNHLDQGLRLEEGDVVIDFNDEQARIQKAQFNVYYRNVPRNRILELGPLIQGFGTVSAQGVWNLNGLGGQVGVSMNRVPILQRTDRWMIVQGQLTAQQPRAKGEPIGVRGDFEAVGAYVEDAADGVQTLGSDVVVRGRQAPKTGAGPALDMALSVKLGPHFYLNAQGLRTRLAGGLSLTMADPSGRGGQRLQGTGSINAVDGTFRAYGQDLSIERGVVSFAGPLDNPGLNIRAVRKGASVEAGVEITGSARRPQVSLVSEPAVPDSEKLSWMILGRGSNSADRESALLLTAAAAIFGDNEDSTTRKIARAVGIDNLALSTGSLTAADSRAVGSKVAVAPGADRNARVFGADDPLLNQRIVTLGKQLNDNINLSYEQSVTTAAYIFKLVYQYSRAFSVITRVGADSAVDLLYQITYK